MTKEGGAAEAPPSSPAGYFKPNWNWIVESSLSVMA
jgi:hypothetical protein